MADKVLTEPVFAALLDAVRQGVPVTTACQTAGIARETLYRFLERDPAARTRYEAMRADWEAELVKAIQQTALDQTHRDSFHAKKFMLTHWPSTRQTYREERRSVVEYEGKDQRAIQLHTTVRELPNEQLLALGEALESVEDAVE